jgi:phage N-6-adenine-methyltransferase
MNIHFSTEQDTWSTPTDLFQKLNDEFHFTLDPCCSTETAKCSKFFTKEDNGLIQNWSNEIVFMNPPYGKNQTKIWMKKAYEESRNGATVVALVPARTDTLWFHEYALLGEVRFIRGRLRFSESKQPAPFPSIIVVFRPS